MSAEIPNVEPIAHYPLDLPTDILLTNMLVYHAVSFRRDVEGLVPRNLQIIYESSEPDAVRQYQFTDSPKRQRPDAYQGKLVLHPPTGSDQYVGTAHSITNAEVVRPGIKEPSSLDVPEGIFALEAADAIKIGRPDLGKTERRKLQATTYAPYYNQFVIRQDKFVDGGNVFRQATITQEDELRRLHNCMGGSRCVCRTMVRYDHFGPLVTMPQAKMLTLLKSAKKR